MTTNAELLNEYFTNDKKVPRFGNMTVPHTKGWYSIFNVICGAIVWPFVNGETYDMEGKTKRTSEGYVYRPTYCSIDNVIYKYRSVDGIRVVCEYGNISENDYIEKRKDLKWNLYTFSPGFIDFTHKADSSFGQFASRCNLSPDEFVKLIVQCFKIIRPLDKFILTNSLAVMFSHSPTKYPYTLHHTREDYAYNDSVPIKPNTITTGSADEYDINGMHTSIIEERTSCPLSGIYKTLENYLEQDNYSDVRNLLKFIANVTSGSRFLFGDENPFCSKDLNWNRYQIQCSDYGVDIDWDAIEDDADLDDYDAIDEITDMVRSKRKSYITEHAQRLTNNLHLQEPKSYGVHVDSVLLPVGEKPVYRNVSDRIGDYKYVGRVDDVTIFSFYQNGMHRRVVMMKGWRAVRVAKNHYLIVGQRWRSKFRLYSFVFCTVTPLTGIQCNMPKYEKLTDIENELLHCMDRSDWDHTPKGSVLREFAFVFTQTMRAIVHAVNGGFDISSHREALWKHFRFQNLSSSRIQRLHALVEFELRNISKMPDNNPLPHEYFNDDDSILLAVCEDFDYKKKKLPMRYHTNTPTVSEYAVGQSVKLHGREVSEHTVTYLENKQKFACIDFPNTHVHHIMNYKLGKPTPQFSVELMKRARLLKEYAEKIGSDSNTSVPKVTRATLEDAKLTLKPVYREMCIGTDDYIKYDSEYVNRVLEQNMAPVEKSDTIGSDRNVIEEYKLYKSRDLRVKAMDCVICGLLCENTCRMPYAKDAKSAPRFTETEPKATLSDSETKFDVDHEDFEVPREPYPRNTRSSSVSSLYSSNGSSINDPRRCQAAPVESSVMQTDPVKSSRSSSVESASSSSTVDVLDFNDRETFLNNFLLIMRIREMLMLESSGSIRTTGTS